MKRIGIIIKRKRLNSYENTAFRKEAGKLGINLDFIFIEDVSVKVTKEGIKLYYLSQTFNDYDFIFNRLGSGITNKESCIVDAISCVYKVYNNGSCAQLLKDKFRTSLILQQHNISVIPTMINEKNIKLDTINKLMEYPLVHKSNSGSIGKGIYKIDNQEQLNQMMEFSDLIAQDYFYLLQDFVDYKPGEDIRVIMFKDKVVGAMKRHSDGEDFRTNFSIYQQATPFSVDDKLLKLCQQVMKTLPVDIAGIDLLETKDGYVVCEVNSAPGFMGLDSVSNKNIANKLIYEGYKMLEY